MYNKLMSTELESMCGTCARVGEYPNVFWCSDKRGSEEGDREGQGVLACYVRGRSTGETGQLRRYSCEQPVTPCNNKKMGKTKL